MHVVGAPASMSCPHLLPGLAGVAATDEGCAAAPDGATLAAACLAVVEAVRKCMRGGQVRALLLLLLAEGQRCRR